MRRLEIKLEKRSELSGHANDDDMCCALSRKFIATGGHSGKLRLCHPGGNHHIINYTLVRVLDNLRDTSFASSVSL